MEPEKQSNLWDVVLKTDRWWKAWQESMKLYREGRLNSVMAKLVAKSYYFCSQDTMDRPTKVSLLDEYASCYLSMPNRTNVDELKVEIFDYLDTLTINKITQSTVFFKTFNLLSEYFIRGYKLKKFGMERILPFLRCCSGGTMSVLVLLVDLVLEEIMSVTDAFEGMNAIYLVGAFGDLDTLCELPIELLPQNLIGAAKVSEERATRAIQSLSECYTCEDLFNVIARTIWVTCKGSIPNSLKYTLWRSLSTGCGRPFSTYDRTKLSEESIILLDSLAEEV